MEKSMQAWAASMQMRNRAASLLQVSQPASLLRADWCGWKREQDQLCRDL